ncbi:hypothetical protein PYW08_000615 [Mythimna loreyi]|uniref:Uncharacterized protein n=1 Tax=Mythimna loreyi TaxID=667449 RepID=A0ACC2RCZ9_9NEOP|nr:hypothetical protein PYW08_000615 [Mythimna loreyi]
MDYVLRFSLSGCLITVVASDGKLPINPLSPNPVSMMAASFAVNAEALDVCGGREQYLYRPLLKPHLLTLYYWFTQSQNWSPYQGVNQDSFLIESQSNSR